MTRLLKSALLSSLLITGGLVGLGASRVAAQGAPAKAPPAASAAPGTMRLTLEDVKQRVAADNKLLHLAALNVKSKEYATRAMRANYFPQVIGSTVYFHFNDNLGDVITFGGRTLHGPLGRPLGTLPVTSVDLPLIDQNSSFTTIAMVQPITDLLKVRQGVNLARADEQIAQAKLEKGTRELLSG